MYVKHNTKGKTYEEFEEAMDRDNFMNPGGIDSDLSTNPHKRSDNEDPKDPNLKAQTLKQFNKT